LDENDTEFQMKKNLSPPQLQRQKFHLQAGYSQNMKKKSPDAKVYE
jgi:hypothetical protein